MTEPRQTGLRMKRNSFLSIQRRNFIAQIYRPKLFLSHFTLIQTMLFYCIIFPWSYLSYPATPSSYSLQQLILTLCSIPFYFYQLFLPSPHSNNTFAITLFFKTLHTCGSSFSLPQNARFSSLFTFPYQPHWDLNTCNS